MNNAYNNEDDPIHNENSEQLTHLLYHQVFANAQLQENSTFHGDINPNLIFRDNKGDFKLLVKRNLPMGISHERM